MIVFLPIMCFNRSNLKALLEQNSLVAKTLKPYYKRYNWLFAITIIDILVEISINLADLFDKNFVNSDFFRVT